MKITKRDEGRAVIFQGFDNGIYQGYIDECKTTKLGYTFARIVYRCPQIMGDCTAILEKEKWNRLSFRVIN